MYPMRYTNSHLWGIRHTFLTYESMNVNGAVVSQAHYLSTFDWAGYCVKKYR